MSNTTLENIANFLYEKCHDRGMTTTAVMVALSEFLGVAIPMQMEGVVREYRRSFVGLEKLASMLDGLLPKSIVGGIDIPFDIENDEMPKGKCVFYFHENGEVIYDQLVFLWDGKVGMCSFLTPDLGIVDEKVMRFFLKETLVNTSNTGCLYSTMIATIDNINEGESHVLYKMDADIPIHTYYVTSWSDIELGLQITKKKGTPKSMDVWLDTTQASKIYDRGNLFKITNHCEGRE